MSLTSLTQKDSLCNIDTCDIFYKHFTHVIHSPCKISCIVHCRHGPVQYFQKALAYFDRFINYMCKMFMKLTPDHTWSQWGRREAWFPFPDPAEKIGIWSTDIWPRDIWSTDIWSTDIWPTFGQETFGQETFGPPRGPPPNFNYYDQGNQTQSANQGNQSARSSSKCSIQSEPKRRKVSEAALASRAKAAPASGSS